MKSLNKAEGKDLFYYCNSCGDIMIPNSDQNGHYTEDDLPPSERDLYENYWNENSGCYMYIVNYKGMPYMALNLLFEKDYLREIQNKEDVSMKDFYDKIFQYAQVLEQQPIMKDCKILIGDNTEYDGHELMVLIPYKKRDKIKEIANILSNSVYAAIEALVSYIPAIPQRTLSQSSRDNLLVTMGCRAGAMECLDENFVLPGGIEGEAQLANFVAEAVDRYINMDIDESFDCYIEDLLEKQYQNNDNGKQNVVFQRAKAKHGKLTEEKLSSVVQLLKSLLSDDELIITDHVFCIKDSKKACAISEFLTQFGCTNHMESYSRNNSANNLSPDLPSQLNIICMEADLK